jgi:hypothetical protein
MYLIKEAATWKPSTKNHGENMCDDYNISKEEKESIITMNIQS